MEFVQNYALCIQDPKWSDNLFQVCKCGNGPLNNYMERFKVTMLGEWPRLVHCGNIFPYETFAKSQSTDPIILNNVKHYQDAKVLTSQALSLEKSRWLDYKHAFEAHTQKKEAQPNNSRTKNAHSNKMEWDDIGFPMQAFVLPPLNQLVSQIYNATEIEKYGCLHLC